MARGNRTNHKKIYLTCEAFQKWCDNDFAHLIRRVNFQDIKLTFLLAGIGIILAIVALTLTLLFKVI